MTKSSAKLLLMSGALIAVALVGTASLGTEVGPVANANANAAGHPGRDIDPAVIEAQDHAVPVPTSPSGGYLRLIDSQNVAHGPSFMPRAGEGVQPENDLPTTDGQLASDGYGHGGAPGAFSKDGIAR